MEKQFEKHPRFAYEASRDGIIRNCKTKRIVGRHHDVRGYFRVHVGENKRAYSHNIIYECFHGLIDQNQHVIHDNGDRSDNRLENLSAVTQTELRKKSAKKSITMMHRGYKYTFKSIKDAAIILGVNESSVSKSAQGKHRKVYSRLYNELISLKYSDKKFYFFCKKFE